MITVKNLSKHFGGIKAVDGVDLHIDRGSITGLVGPNGAGKTSLIEILCGRYKQKTGNVIYKDQNINDKKAVKIAPVFNKLLFSFIKSYKPYRLQPPKAGMESKNDIFAESIISLPVCGCSFNCCKM